MSARAARRQIASQIFVVVCGIATLIALFALGLILYSLLKQGIGGLNLAVFTQDTPGPDSIGGLCPITLACRFPWITPRVAKNLA